MKYNVDQNKNKGQPDTNGMNQKNLKKLFFSKVYKGKSWHPLYQSIFNWLWDATQVVEKGAKVLNIYSSHDRSSEREDIYRNSFFKEAVYQELDFSKDAFIDDLGKRYADHQVPFPDDEFDLVVTTKVILEHISNPSKFLQECHRVLKNNGYVFLIAPFVRRQHQAPYDFFRFTQFSLEYLLKKSGFQVVYIKPTNGSITTAAFMSTFFISGLPCPWLIKKLFFIFTKIIIDPLTNFLDRYDKDKNIPLYFVVKAVKI